MREYDETTLKIANRIFENGDAILEQRKKRSAMIKRLTFSVSGLCAAIIAVAGIWHNNAIKNAVHRDEIPVIMEVSTTETTSASTIPNETTSSVTSDFSHTTKTTTSVSSAKTTSVTEKTDSSTISVTSQTTSLNTTANTEPVTQTSNYVNNNAAVANSTQTETSTTLSNTKETTARTTNTISAPMSASNTNMTAITTSKTSATEHTNVDTPVITNSSIQSGISHTTTSTSVVTTSSTTTTVVTVRADFRKSSEKISQVSFSSVKKETYCYVDENDVQHQVELKQSDELSADELIRIIGDTCFMDNNVFGYSGIYEGTITNDVLYFDMMHYSYDSDTETIYSTQMKVYCIRTDDGGKAYAVKLPQSDDYYLYTVSKGDAERIYWREKLYISD